MTRFTEAIRGASLAPVVIPPVILGERIVECPKTVGEAQRVHDAFAQLLSSCRPEEILEAVQRLAGTAVVLDSEHHYVPERCHRGPADRPLGSRSCSARAASAERGLHLSAVCL